MNRGRTIFAQVMQFIPLKEFARCVKCYDGERYSFDSPVVIQGVEKGDVGKGEAGHFLEAHISSKGVKLEKIWHKSEGKSSAGKI